jgi:glycerol kinase
VSADAVLALDLGTTGVRALVVSAEGRVLSRAYRALSLACPAPGRVEQDPEELWTRSVEVMRAALAEAKTDVAAVGVVTQRATALAWDAASGRPLAPAIGWQDQRTAERVAWFRERGIPLNTLASATKFEWWLQNDAAVRKAAGEGTLRLGTPDTWLTWRLTGGAAHVTDPGNASCTALYDAAGAAWAAPLVALFGVPAEALPAVVATSGVVGETPRELLGRALPVAARAGDQQAACFAQGVHAAGDAKLTLGSSAMLDLHTGGAPMAPAPPGAYPLALWRLGEGPDAYCVEGTVITAGSAVEWAVAAGIARDAASLSELAARVASTDGVWFVPALQGLGTPFLDDGARGALGGLTLGAGAPQLARALLEGIAHRCVDVCEALGLGPSPLRVDGGLAQSEPLLELLADLSGRPVARAAEVETTALGAAFLAGLAVGRFESPAACRARIAPPLLREPRMAGPARRAARERWSEVLERARAGRQ